MIALYFEGSPADLPDVLKQFARLIEVMVASFGAWGTIALFALVLLAFLMWRLYNERRKDKRVDELLSEKDRTIQRLSAESRNYKILLFKETLKWSDEQIDRLIVKNEFDDVVSARKALEGEKPTVSEKTLKPESANKKPPRSKRR